MGSKVSKTRYKAAQHVVYEIDEMKCEMKDHGTKIHTILNILQGRPTQDPDLASSGTFQSVANKASTVGESSSTRPMSAESSPLKTHKSFYHLRDLKNEKDIVMATVDTVQPGTVVYSRPLKCPEAKVAILSIYRGIENEPVYLDRKWGVTCLGDFGEGSFIVWPIYLLKEMS